MLALGELNALSLSGFKVPTGATGVSKNTSFDTTDHIIYNQTIGILYSHVDGGAPNAAIQAIHIGTKHPKDVY